MVRLAVVITIIRGVGNGRIRVEKTNKRHHHHEFLKAINIPAASRGDIWFAEKQTRTPQAAGNQTLSD